MIEVYSDPLKPSYFERCVFSDNVALNGVVFVYNAGAEAVVFKDCAFTNNVGLPDLLHWPAAGAIYCENSNVVFDGCTIASTLSRDGMDYPAAGILKDGSGNVSVSKSIIAFNHGPAVYDLGTLGSVSMANGVVFENLSSYGGPTDQYWVTTGENVVNLDPAFCDKTNGDYHLYAFSPASAPAPPYQGYFGERIGAFDIGCVPPADVAVSTPYPFAGNPSLIVACPQGDGVWRLDVSVDLNGPITRSIDQTEVVLDVGDCNNVVFFDGDGYVRAGSDAVGPSYATTIAHSHLGAYGTETVDILLNGVPLAPPAQATFTIRTPDFNGDGVAANIIDFPAFTTGDFCGCPPYTGSPIPVTNDPRDFNNDGVLSFPDFAFYGSHYEHSSPYSAVPAPSEVAQSNAGIALRFTEEYPTATTHRLYVDVDVENFAGIANSQFAMAPSNQRLAFVEWRQVESSLGLVLFAPIVRDGEPQMFFGTAVSESFNGSTSHLGQLVFDVAGAEPFEVAEEDFLLAYGEVLLGEPGGVGTVAQMSGVMRRTLDPAVARIFHNRLEQNFPNPFNPSTTLAFSLKDGGSVTLTIYDVGGRRVRELVNERRDRGAYKVTWDGQNDTGQIVASGVYFYKLIAGSFTDTKKMTILK